MRRTYWFAGRDRVLVAAMRALGAFRRADSVADVARDAAGNGADGAEVPAPVRAACVILLLEALGLAGLAAFYIYDTVFGSPHSVAAALLSAAFALLGAFVLVLCARGLLRLRPAARTPIIVLQLLALPVSYSLAFQAGLPAVGGPILIAALAVIYLLFTPPARSALDRDISR
jgi:hypothetical protein